jgi:hypothetical protein
MDEIKDDLVDKIKDAFNSVLIPDLPNNDDYPEDAVPQGTYVRSIRFDKLGVVTDAFYGDVDTTGKKIIMYSVLLFPKKDMLGMKTTKSEQYYLSNEYEYEIIAYLMKAPAKLSDITAIIGGGLY